MRDTAWMFPPPACLKKGAYHVIIQWMQWKKNSDFISRDMHIPLILYNL